jgi:hypothetical protein
MAAAALIGAAALAGLASGLPAAIAPFSSATPGAALPTGWELVRLRNLRAPQVQLVEDAGTTVLRVDSSDAAGSVAFRVAADPQRTPVLSWRWKVDRVVEGADLRRKEGDDFAARVYVAFDVPASSLTLAERARMALARLLYGAEIPTAAICYVWDNRYPVGTTAWNAYTSHVRMVVLRSGPSEAGRWVSEARDVAVDFREAFGEPAPSISGVAVSADTDQTHERVTAWFGDLRLGARR